MGVHISSCFITLEEDCVPHNLQYNVRCTVCRVSATIITHICVLRCGTSKGCEAESSGGAVPSLLRPHLQSRVPHGGDLLHAVDRPLTMCSGYCYVPVTHNRQPQDGGVRAGCGTVRTPHECRLWDITGRQQHVS